jgi:mannose-6-phosphate isomerase-like protein (cupin superfamily)
MPHLEIHADAVWPRKQRAVVVTTSDLGFQSSRRAITMRGTGTTQPKENEMPTIDTAHVLLAPGEGELIEVAGNRIRIIVASRSQLVCDYSAAPRFAGPPVHVHPGFDETYLVLEGRLQMTIGAERRELAPGAAAYVSGSLPHTFANPSGERVRFLSICCPGGFEDFFRAVAAGDREAMAEVSERFGYEPVAHELT